LKPSLCLHSILQWCELHWSRWISVQNQRQLLPFFPFFLFSPENAVSTPLTSPDRSTAATRAASAPVSTSTFDAYPSTTLTTNSIRCPGPPLRPLLDFPLSVQPLFFFSHTFRTLFVTMSLTNLTYLITGAFSSLFSLFLSVLFPPSPPHIFPRLTLPRFFRRLPWSGTWLLSCPPRLFPLDKARRRRPQPVRLVGPAGARPGVQGPRSPPHPRHRGR
jgi:hypothetical protein